MRPASILPGLVLAACALPAVAAERLLELELGAPARIEINNLAGQVRLVPTDGQLTVRARVSADSAELADQVRLLTQDSNGRPRLVVEYPASVTRVTYDGDEFRRLDARVEYHGRQLRVTSSGGERIRVDLDIEVPADTVLGLRNVVGPVSAERLSGELRLGTHYGAVQVLDSTGSLRADTRSGSIAVHGFRGDVVADTGSGRVEIENVLGKVRADTGSGRVTLRGVDGDIVADTGSGAVSITDVRAGRILVDTGSGGARLRDVSGSLKVDTGSGAVTVEGLVAGPELVVDTGSGSVSLAGDLSAVRRLVVDTGSGSVTLASSAPLSLQLDVRTGSGGIRVDLPNLGQVETGRRRFRAVAGAGEGTARIVTGSGSVRISGP